MARDRKRAKQRQQRRAARAASGTPAAPRDQRRDEDDTSVAPNPLEHASADADLAEASERTGQPAEDFIGDEEGAVYEDELTPDEEEPGEEAAIRPSRRRRGEPTAVGEAPRRGGNRFINFLRACVVELGRVQWPDRRAVTQATGVVLGFVVIAGAYLGLLDAVWSRVVDAIL
ncbi:MAG TPA: preprotein translocase subunit SecE [Solirubrobacteraceae bacterium]|nr:preprotein translocase subunit SecE [Solirubrobacteraceae bacterium]